MIFPVLRQFILYLSCASLSWGLANKILYYFYNTTIPATCLTRIINCNMIIIFISFGIVYLVLLIYYICYWPTDKTKDINSQTYLHTQHGFVCMGPAANKNHFKLYPPFSVTGGAVIVTVTFNVSMEHRVFVEESPSRCLAKRGVYKPIWKYNFQMGSGGILSFIEIGSGIGNLIGDTQTHSRQGVS
jgi:hypothetical protein